MSSVAVETAPVAEFLEQGARHLDRRAGLEEGARGSAIGSAGLEELSAWRETSAALRETAQRLLGGGDAAENPGCVAAGQHAAPAGPGRRGFSTGWRRDRATGPKRRSSAAAAETVEARARQADTLPLHARGLRPRDGDGEGDRRTGRAAGGSVRREAGAWLDRDRGWREELASVRSLTGE